MPLMGSGFEVSVVWSEIDVSDVTGVVVVGCTTVVVTSTPPLCVVVCVDSLVDERLTSEEWSPPLGPLGPPPLPPPPVVSDMLPF